MAEQETTPQTPKDSEGSEKLVKASHVICRSTYELIREAAARNTGQTAIALLTEGESSDRTGCLSYAALLNGIHQTANLLADLGVEPGDVIALLLPNLLETHLLLWGGQAAGTVCPLPPWLPVEQTIALLRVARAKILVAAGPEVNQELWQKAEEVRREVKSITALLQVRGPGKERDGVYAFDALLADYPVAALHTRRKIDPDDIAVSLPLRGETEMPGLVSLTHANLLDVAWAIGPVLGLAPEEVLLRGLLHFIQACW
ncbi:MAG TPA: AMP-binding protein [Ktedonobacteraceae bacterium]